MNPTIDRNQYSEYNMLYSMDAVTYSDLRKNLKSYMDQVYDDREPLIITRQVEKTSYYSQLTTITP